MWEKELIAWMNGQNVEFTDGGKWCLLSPILAEHTFSSWIQYSDRKFRIAKTDRERIDTALVMLKGLYNRSSTIEIIIKELES
jgi:hypothetical protein